MRTLISALFVALALPGPALAATNGQLAVGRYGIGTLDAVAHDPLLGSTELHVLSADGDEPDWSPDGNRIVFTGTGGISVVDLSGAIQHVTTTPDGEHDRFPHWTADGTRIVFLRGDNSYALDVVMIVTPGAPEQPMGASLPDTHGIDWAPDGRYARITSGRELAVGTLGGTETVIARDVYGGPAWSPDGTTIAFASSGYVALVPATGGDVTPLTARTSDSIAHLDFSQDGRKVVFDYRVVISHTASDLRVVTIADKTVEVVGSSTFGGLVEPSWQPCIAGVTVSCVSTGLSCPRATLIAAPGRSTISARLCPGASLVAIIHGPAHGSAFLDGGGSLTYHPAAGYRGPDEVYFSATRDLDEVRGSLVIRVASAPKLTPLARPRLARRVRLRARCDVRCTVRLRVSATLRSGRVVHGRTVKATGTTLSLHLPAPNGRHVVRARIAGTVTGPYGLHRTFTLTLKR